jgi:hypothetical protein
MIREAEGSLPGIADEQQRHAGPETKWQISYKSTREAALSRSLSVGAS